MTRRSNAGAGGEEGAYQSVVDVADPSPLAIRSHDLESRYRLAPEDRDRADIWVEDIHAGFAPVAGVTSLPVCPLSHTFLVFASSSSVRG